MVSTPAVHVVDDDPGALRSLCWLIRQADLPVRAFGSGREFLDSCHSEEAGCVVLDLRMPEMSGLEVQRCLGERGIRLPIIFITAHGDVPACRQAFRAGAFDFLEKPLDDKLLLDHIQKALARDAQQKELGSEPDFAGRTSQLTPREKLVFDMLVSCKTLKDIAAATNVTVQTVWRHRSNILRKMGVANDAELVRMATRHIHRHHP
jgi:two-component system, LuxR family, response regulator FixJ